MTDAEIITRLAVEIHGWHVSDNIFDPIYPKLLSRQDGTFTFRNSNSECHRWNPLEFWADAMELQAAIPDEMRFAYQRALDREVSPEGVRQTGVQQEWNLIAATPRQRCMAMIAMLDARRKVPVAG
jgi:hypothetical protein